MQVFKNISQILTLEGAHNKDGRKVKSDDLGIIEDGAIVFNDREIIWVGPQTELPEDYKSLPSRDLSGHTLTPEIVDPHTHTIFGGNRAFEYSLRLGGADYEEIAKAGGGILNTMKATNESSIEQLYHNTRERISRIHSYGIGTIEIKTGYALNITRELECLKVLNDLKKEFAPKVQIKTTLMPAHAIPKTFSSGKEYIDQVVFPCLEKAKTDSDFDATDIFHEQGYFGNEDTKYFLNWCNKNGIPVKTHADEFHDNGGAQLACEHNALSCDHLLQVSDKGIECLSKAQTVATLLPGTGFFLGKSQAPARKLLDGGAKVAFASDYNPGSCHCDNLLLITSLAAPNMKFSLAELWTGITHNSAHALGLNDQGAIVKGMKPRFSLFNVPQVDEITYNWGQNLSVTV
jgi:imidazolonepropionase